MPTIDELHLSIQQNKARKLRLEADLIEAEIAADCPTNACLGVGQVVYGPSPEQLSQLAAPAGSTPDRPRYVAAKFHPGCCPEVAGVFERSPAVQHPLTFEEVAQARCDLFNNTYPVGSTIALCKPDNRREPVTVTRQCEVVKEHGFRKPLCVVQINGNQLVTLGVLDCGI